MAHPALVITHASEQAEADAWIEQALPEAVSTVIFIGGGLGHMLEALEHRHPSARAVVLEPDVAVARALTAREDWSAWMNAGRLAVLTGPDYAGAAQVARQFGDLTTAPVLTDPRLEQTRPDAVETARRALARLAFQGSANEGARRASAARYLLQTLANAPRMTRESDVSVLAGLLTGIPAVVVAAGPSLDQNVHDLAPVLDRVIVIACDTAARPLLSLGVEPDFVVATDASRANAAHLSSLLVSRSFLVAEGSLNASAFAQFDGRTFFFRVADHEPWPWLVSMGLDPGRIDTWGSVATSAFSLALSLGCNPIGFIGADFAFTGGRPYCRGTSFESLWASWTAGGATLDAVWQTLIDRWPAVSEPDITGAPARTAPHLVSFRDWIVDRAASHPDRRVINATGAGLLAGPSIAQGRLSTTLADVAPLDRALLHRVLRAAHQSRRGDLPRLLAGVTSLLAATRDQTLERWIEFTSGAVTDPAIESALRSPEHAVWMLARHAAMTEAL
jgi:hypothetical protein